MVVKTKAMPVITRFRIGQKVNKRVELNPVYKTILFLIALLRQHHVNTSKSHQGNRLRLLLKNIQISMEYGLFKSLLKARYFRVLVEL